MNAAKLYNFPLIFRRYSASAKIKFTTNEKVLSDLERSVYKPRKHPGIIKHKSVVVPSNIVTAIHNVTADYPIKKILSDAQAMNNYLNNKVPPMEPAQIQSLRDDIFHKIYTNEQRRLKEKFTEVQDDPTFNQSIKDRVIQGLKEKVYNWKPVTYNAYNCLVYLIARFPMEYAVLTKIFAEIQQRDEQFKPRSLFDFGSGTGSAMWACNAYFGKMFEYFNVDTSSFMNELSMSLLCGGRGNKEIQKNVFYRQFLPSTNNLYDIVVSSYSLLELPSSDQRLEVILKLWNKTGRYLILVENGSNAGFRVINEARDFVLQIGKTHEHSQGHVFSPCPHDLSCPRFTQDTTPCNFPIKYHTLPIGKKVEVRNDLYCYVVLYKGKRTEHHATTNDDISWPRIVRETLVRSRHTICRMCTNEGCLDEMIFTAAKHGKSTYQCARASRWGDRIPIHMKASTNTTEPDVDATSSNKSKEIK